MVTKLVNQVASVQSAFVRKSTEKCCKAAAIVQRRIYFAKDGHKYVLPSQPTVCKEHKSAPSEKLTGLFSSNQNNPSMLTTICREMVFGHSKYSPVRRLITGYRREHWPMAREVMLSPQHYHQHNLLLPSPSTSACLWSSATQVLLTPSAAHLHSCAQVRTPPQNQRGQKRLQTRASLSLLSQTYCALIS